MEKLRAQHRKFMAGKAGFSLVELIIVIAIMAALIAVLAPQYLKYVEKSRITATHDTAGELYRAAQVVASDPDYTGGEFTITWDLDASATVANKSGVTGNGPTLYGELIDAAALPANKSAKMTAANNTLTITVSSSGLSVSGNGVDTAGTTTAWNTVLGAKAS